MAPGDAWLRSDPSPVVAESSTNTLVPQGVKGKKGRGEYDMDDYEGHEPYADCCDDEPHQPAPDHPVPFPDDQPERQESQQKELEGQGQDEFRFRDKTRSDNDGNHTSRDGQGRRRIFRPDRFHGDSFVGVNGIVPEGRLSPSAKRLNHNASPGGPIRREKENLPARRGT